MKEPTIAEEIEIQNEIEKALEKVKQKYGICIDYLWSYKK